MQEIQQHICRYASGGLLAPCDLESCEETGISEYEDVRVSGLILIGDV